MNPLTRCARTSYYKLFQILTKLVLPNKARLYGLGALLGKIRFRVGYVGKMRSKAWYLKYLREALPHLTEKRRREILQRFWIDHEKAFLELFVMHSLTKENIDEFVEFEGLDVLDECLKEGKGAVLSVPHFGNSKLVHISLAIKGYPMNVISSRYLEASETVRRIILDPALKWHKVGYPDMSPRWMLSTLKSNEVLQISPTAFGASRGTWTTFLGGKVLVSSSPVRLALSTGAPILPCFMFRLDDDRHRLEICPPLKIEEHADQATTVDENTRALLRIVEEYTAQYPDQFYWMWFVIRRQQAEGLVPAE